MKKYLLLLCITFALTPTFQSCKLMQGVQIVSPFNADLVKDINSLAMQYDLFSVTIEQATDKAYDTYAADYASMEVLSNSISARVDAMPKSGLMLKQADLVRDVVLQYKDYHKTKIKINNSEIRTNRIYFKDIVKPLLVSSMALK